MDKYNPFTNPIEIKCQGADILPLEKIIKFQGNLKKLSNENRDKLLRSITKNGFIAPFFIWNNNGEYMLLDGHQRVSTLIYMQEKGWDLPGFPVVYVDADNEKDAREKLLSITSQFGTFDMDELNDWLSDMDDDISESIRLVDQEIELALGIDDLVETVGDDDIPEEVEPVTKLGDLWELGEHRLLCGDSTKVEDVERLMDGQKADMVFTDPPYGKSESGKRANRDGKTSLSKHIDYENFNDESIEPAIKAFKICEDLKIPRQVWWGANYYTHHIPQSNNWFVWDKRVEDKQKDTQSDCELAWVKSKWSSIRIFRHLWKGMIKGSEHGEHRVHPTQKPIALALWSFDYFKDVNFVLDLFGGSGFTLIACEQSGRKSYIMELTPHYCDVIRDRYIQWCENNGKTPIVKLNGEVWNG